MSDDEDYEIGYGRPPKCGQFRKGQSGNPKGRPKGVKNFKTELDAVLRSRVTLTFAGNPKKVGTIKAVLMRLKEKALKGEQRAIECLLSYAISGSEDADARQKEHHLRQVERDILDRYGLSENRDDANRCADE